MTKQATVITGEAIPLFRMKTLLSGLSLELKGMEKKGTSCYAVIKTEFGLKGSKQKVYDQFKKIVDEHVVKARMG